MSLQTVEPAIQNNSAFVAKQASGKATAATPTPSADFNTFLTLLTTQLRNQDPLKPMESTDFVAQLASFSAVEQQVRTNDKLTEIANLLAANSADGFAGKVGTKVLAPVSVEWKGAPIDITWKPVEGSQKYRLRVLDSSGAPIDIKELGGLQAANQWSGQLQDGTLAPIGFYRFEIESLVGTDVINQQMGLVEASIESLQIVGGVASFVFTDGTALPAADFL
jgi:flagellar basal-body rod modification protein FlgD